MVFRGSAVSTARQIFTRFRFGCKPSLGHSRPPTCGARIFGRRPPFEVLFFQNVLERRPNF
eukprot:2236522-Prymnesium_polylepis.2